MGSHSKLVNTLLKCQVPLSAFLFDRLPSLMETMNRFKHIQKPAVSSRTDICAPADSTCIPGGAQEVFLHTHGPGPQSRPPGSSGPTLHLLRPVPQDRSCHSSNKAAAQCTPLCVLGTDLCCFWSSQESVESLLTLCKMRKLLEAASCPFTG